MGILLSSIIIFLAGYSLDLTTIDEPLIGKEDNILFENCEPSSALAS